METSDYFKTGTFKEIIHGYVSELLNNKRIKTRKKNRLKNKLAKKARKTNRKNKH